MSEEVRVSYYEQVVASPHLHRLRWEDSLPAGRASYSVESLVEVPGGGVLARLWRPTRGGYDGAWWVDVITRQHSSGWLTIRTSETTAGGVVTAFLRAVVLSSVADPEVVYALPLQELLGAALPLLATLRKGIQMGAVTWTVGGTE